MEIEEFEEPRSHLIIKNFLTDDELQKILKEIESLEKSMKQGLYKEVGEKEKVVSEIKDNEQIDLEDFYGHWTNSDILSIFMEKIALFKEMEFKNPVYESFKFMTQWKCKLSAYRNKDYYKFHKDSSITGILTTVLTLCKEPQKFTGGDFILRFNGKEKTIPFENNTIIIFPRTTEHCVTPIKVEKKEFMDSRFSIQFWVSLVF